MYRPNAPPIAVADDPDAALALLTSAPRAVVAAALPTWPRHPHRRRRRDRPRARGGWHVESIGRRAALPVLVRRVPGAPIVHIGVYAIGGAATSPQTLAGLTTLLVRTSLKGTERRSRDAPIAEESELLGAVMGTSVTADGIGWTISVPATRVGAGDRPARRRRAARRRSPRTRSRPSGPSRWRTSRSSGTTCTGYPVRLAMQAAFGGASVRAFRDRNARRR